MTGSTKHLLLSNLTGVVVASLALSTIYTEFGYSEGANTVDFIMELILALITYCSGTLLVYLLFTRRHSVIYNGLCVGLTGSVISFIMKLFFLDRQNGIPAYFSPATKEQLWQQIYVLGTDAISYMIFTTFISLPFLLIGMWLYNRVNRKFA